jgi:prevent-host-death family protein
MQLVKIADLKNNLSRHLARVRRGGQITVMDRDTPVARLVPFTPTEPGTGKAATERTAARVDDLVRQGVLSPGDPRAVDAWLATRQPVALPAGSQSAVDVLLAMRRTSTR